jgi:hypothetical protein
VAYVPFDPDIPDPDNEIELDIADVRENLCALMDAIVMGELVGFDYSWSGGYAYQPTYPVL